MQIQNYIHVLQRAGVLFEAGLSEEEISLIETRYEFSFPPDWKAFLMVALPVSRDRGFINWRAAEPSFLEERLAWPYIGICFDIQVNNFWLPEWGARPEALDEACSIARGIVERAPRLIPIFGHRYIPDRPCEAGNPVFSVYQTDIIYYGANIWNYLENEFSYHFGTPDYHIPDNIREIEFWSRLVDWNNGV